MKQLKCNILYYLFNMIFFVLLFFGITSAVNAGTVMVKDLNPSDSAATNSPWNLTDINGTLFFTVFSSDPAMGYQLWKSDGTEAGTVMVSPSVGTSVTNLTNVNGMLFFTASNNATESKLWKSDGTETVMVNINVKVSDMATMTYSPCLINVNGMLLFVGTYNSMTYQYQLWKSIPSEVNSGSAGVMGDINGDGKIGLEEAIYALQVVAGSKGP